MAVAWNALQPFLKALTYLIPHFKGQNSFAWQVLQDCIHLMHGQGYIHAEEVQPKNEAYACSNPQRRGTYAVKEAPQQLPKDTPRQQQPTGPSTRTDKGRISRALYQIISVLI